MSANPFFRNRVRYRMYHPFIGDVVIQDPEGWQDDDKEFARNEEYHGIFTQFSNSLNFVGDGADNINLIYKLYGVQATIRLIRDEANPKTDVWEEAYRGDLDLSTRKIKNGRVSVKFNNSGIETILKSRETEQVEIERTTTIDGKPMDELPVNIVALAGREILLNTMFDIVPSDNTAGVYVNSGPNSGGVDRDQSVGVPLNMFSQSHENAQSISPETRAGEYNGTTGIMFFAVTPLARTLSISLDITFLSNLHTYDDVNHGSWGLFIGKYSGGESYNIVERIQLFNSNDHGGLTGLGGDHFTNIFNGENSNPKKSWSVNWSGDISLQAGESLSLEFFVKANLASSFHDGSLGIRAENITASMKIVEDSYYPPTQSKFVLAYDLANRLAEIMTGAKNSIRSTIFGRTDVGYIQDGKAALNGFAHGFWVRGFEKFPLSTVENPNAYKPLTTSWKDFITSMQAVWNVGLGIERNGYKETIILEELSYFYNRQVTVRLPLQVNNVERDIAPKYYYSGIEIGYSKGGEYEEAMGLDEYNTKSTFTTIISRLKNTYSKLSAYRADSYGKEFARRKSKLGYPTEDTRYDNDVFIMDLKRTTTDVFEERIWQDDFEKAPEGTYSPSTATNLRLSPFNMLLRHGWVIAAGLTKYATDYVRYGSSTANSALKTKLIGGNEYAENGNIVNSELSKPRFVPEFVEFEHELSIEIKNLIEGFTEVDGRKIPNVYGLFEFINEDGLLEKGYLINLKPNQNKFKLLTANT